MNGKLCIEEVGVDLELCVHAHGYDVEFIMKASRKINNYPLGINSSCIYELVPCDHGSDQVVLL